MSQTAGHEADGGGAAALPRDEASGPLAIASVLQEQSNDGQGAPDDPIRALTAAELNEVTQLAEPERVQPRSLVRPPPLPPKAAGKRTRPEFTPYYGALPPASERAELRIEEQRLDRANPFLGSSLLPPPPKRYPWLKPLLISAAAGLMVGAGYATARVRCAGAECVLQPTAATSARTLQPTAAQPIEAIPAAVEVSLPEQSSAAALATSAALAAPSAVAVAAPKSVQPSVVVARAPRASADAPKRAKPRATAAAARKPAALAETEAKPAAALAETQAEPAAAVAETQAKPDSAALSQAAAAEPTPAQPSRAQVQTGLEQVRGALASCADGRHGHVTANVTISGAGRATYSSIEGAFAGTPQGSCMARALRGAQFPPFTSAPLRVRYEYAF